MLPQPPTGKDFVPGVTPPEVLAALDGVLASQAFVRVERPVRFLRHLVETTLAGETHRLKESVLGLEVFGRPASWDPRLDGIVRQEAARLRKRLARYYENDGTQAAVRIELPVGGYVPVFTRLPEAVAAPAAVEIPTVDPRPAGSVARSRRSQWYITAFVLCTAGLLAGSGYMRSVFQAQHPEPSLAVLPLRNLSADPANQYFAEGLTDEITDLLSRNKTLRVAARTSAQLRGKAGDIRAVGRELNVANVLEGSVERSGDRVRIVARLERVSDGSRVWSNTYVRQTSDLFAVQTELAEAIAGSLKAAAGLPSGGGHIPSAEAHESYLKGRYELQQMTHDSLERAKADFQHAIDIDPAYAAAWYALGSVEYDRSGAAVSTRTAPERKAAEQAYRKAAELGPDLPGPHASLASLAMQYDWDWPAAQRELQLALSGPPNASADTFYAYYLTFHGRFAEANTYLQRAQDLDPFGSTTLNNVAGIWFMQGRYAEASDLSKKMLVQAPSMLPPQVLIGIAYIGQGHPEEAVPFFQQMKARFLPAELCEAMACARAGQREQGMRLARPFEEKFQSQGVPAQWFALFYACMGDRANTLKWLERSADRREWQALNLAINPFFRFLHHNPGFEALKKKMGLAD